MNGVQNERLTNDTNKVSTKKSLKKKEYNKNISRVQNEKNENKT